MNQKLNRALKILATCKPETLAEHTCFTVEVCREAIENARSVVGGFSPFTTMWPKAGRHQAG